MGTEKVQKEFPLSNETKSYQGSSDKKKRAYNQQFQSDGEPHFAKEAFGSREKRDRVPATKPPM